MIITRTPWPIFVILAILLCSCGKIREPEFKGVENLRIVKFGLNESTFNMDLHYFNPNKAGLRLKSAEGDAWLDDRYLGHFSLDSLVVIRKLDDFRLPLTFRATTGQVMRNTLGAFLGRDAVIKVEGKAVAGKGGIYIHYPIHYEGKHNLGALLNSPQKEEK